MSKKDYLYFCGLLPSGPNNVSVKCIAIGDRKEFASQMFLPYDAFDVVYKNKTDRQWDCMSEIKPSILTTREVKPIILGHGSDEIFLNDAIGMGLFILYAFIVIFNLLCVHQLLPRRIQNIFPRCFRNIFNLIGTFPIIRYFRARRENRDAIALGLDNA